MKEAGKLQNLRKGIEKHKYKKLVLELAWPVFRFFLLVGLCFVVIYPIIYMLTAAFRPSADMYDPSVMWIPKHLTISNIIDTLGYMEYGKTLSLTLLVNVVSSVMQVAVCAFTGYGFARFKFPFQKLLFGIVIMSIIVPPQIIGIPQYVVFKDLELLDSPFAFYLPAILANGIRAGLFILMFRQNFRGLPRELEDSAYLDGCGPFATFFKIVAPNAGSTVLTVFLFSVVWYWNDVYTSGMFLNTWSTISLKLNNLAYIIMNANNLQTAPPIEYIVWLESGCLITILPLILMYIFLQRYFTESIERSGLVG